MVIVLGPAAGDAETLAAWSGQGGVRVEILPLHGDLFDTLALLCAGVAERPLPAAPEALRALALRLRAARYAVLVGTLARLPLHGELLVEAMHRLIDSLNRSTRAAALWIGGGDGAATVNQTFTWLSGLPLRTRAGPAGLEHDPARAPGRRAGRLPADRRALHWRRRRCRARSRPRFRRG